MIPLLLLLACGGAIVLPLFALYMVMALVGALFEAFVEIFYIIFVCAAILGALAVLAFVLTVALIRAVSRANHPPQDPRTLSSSTRTKIITAKDDDNPMMMMMPAVYPSAPPSTEDVALYVSTDEGSLSNFRQVPPPKPLHTLDILLPPTQQEGLDHGPPSFNPSYKRLTLTKNRARGTDCYGTQTAGSTGPLAATAGSTEAAETETPPFKHENKLLLAATCAYMCLLAHAAGGRKITMDSGHDFKPSTWQSEKNNVSTFNCPNSSNYELWDYHCGYYDYNYYVHYVHEYEQWTIQNLAYGSYEYMEILANFFYDTFAADFTNNLLGYQAFVVLVDCKLFSSKEH